MSKKGYRIVPPAVARHIGKLSKIAALELAYSLAGRLATSADDMGEVYDILRREFSVIATYRQDHPLAVVDETDPLWRGPAA
jgi:hypothetical protein